MQTTVDLSPAARTSAARSHSVVLIATAIILFPPFWFRVTHPAAFGAYWVSGSAAAHHLDPYAQYPIVGKSVVLFRGRERAIADINMNPPCLLPVFQMLSHLGLAGFAAAWTLISAASFAAAILLIRRSVANLRSVQLAWLCLCSAVFDTVGAGQIYFVLLLLATVGLIGIEQRKDIKAAIGMGLLVAIKPTFVFWPIFVAASGRWKPAAKSLVVTAVVWAAAWVTYGSRVYASWFRALRADNHWIEATDIALPAWFARMGLPHAGMALAAVLGAGLILLVCRFRPSAPVASGLGLITGIVCAPLAWAAYAILAAPAFLATSWGRLAKAAAVCLAVPGILVAVVIRNGTVAMYVAGVVYTAGVCLMLFHFAAIAMDVKQRKPIADSGPGVTPSHP